MTPDELTSLSTNLVLGNSILIPKALKEKLRDYSRKKQGQEIAALIWHMVRSVEESKDDGPPHIHSKQFLRIASSRTTTKAKQWLVSEGFLHISDSYRAGHSSKTYKTKQHNNPVEFTLQHKQYHEILPVFTQDDDACKYTREVLNQTTIEETEAVAAVTVRMKELLSDPNLTEQKRKKREKVRMTLAAPILEVVHKKGLVMDKMQQPV